MTNITDSHTTIAKICDDVRGSVDSFDFKNFVFVALFYRYLTQTETVKGIPSIDRLCSDKNGIAERFIESLRTVNDMPTFNGLFDDFFYSDSRIGTDAAQRDERIYKLLSGVASMPLVDGIVDPFGDAYEYMMQMYAANGGRSGGEYFTPKEASELVMRLATCGRDNIVKAYDPTCGSGSLLLQAKKVKPDVKLFGQELNPSTYNLARMNMIVHGVNDADIRNGDTLTNPLHDETFDTIVSNPPYSVKWVGKDDTTLSNDPRFAPAGVLAPKSKADWAFMEHIVSRLNDDGSAAVVVFPGILYRGAAEGKIRKWFVEQNYIDAVIALPDNLFFGTSIGTCIVIMKKNRAEDAPVLFIDATSFCKKDGKKNKLRDEDIQNIVGLYADYKEVQYTTKLATRDDIKDNEYVLSVTTYVETEPDAPKRPLPEIMLDLAMSRREILKGWQREYLKFGDNGIVSPYFVADLMRLVFTDKITVEEIRERMADSYYDGLGPGDVPTATIRNQ